MTSDSLDGDHPELIIHTGYPKTATKWFQFEWMDNHPAIERVLGFEEIVETFIETYPPTFEPARAREAITPRLEKARAGGSIPVLSYEGLSGTGWNGGRDVLEVGRRLHATFPEATVWVMVRNQVDMLVSLYKEYVTHGGAADIERFLGSGAGLLATRMRFALAHYEYEPLIRFYQSLFGEAHVEITLFEDFLADNEGFLKAFSKRLGIPWWEPPRELFRPRHSSLSEAGIGLFRLYNRVSRWPSPDVYPPLRPRGARVIRGLLKRADPLVLDRLGSGTLRQKIANDVTGRFDASNRRLSKLLGRDLGDLGYPV